ncbi:MAG: hypothetical protein IIY07_08240 [Thermoguttaceae bacterium]|nr:hypothetical protein [Thermoguttaceae bacterium]
MNDLKYRVEELELDGDDLRRRVSELEQDVENLDDPGDFDDLEYRVEKLEDADSVDPDDFDALEQHVEKLATDLRARLEALELETRALRDRLAKLEGETK